MNKITRRRLLQTCAIVGTALGTGCEEWGFSPAPTKRSRKKAVVLGSGFGGSVATLRLAEAGMETALVERGRHWVYKGENSYPILGNGFGLLGALLDGTATWADPNPTRGSVGMLENYGDSTMPVGMGACLGGGSVVYGGVLLQPRREVFEQALPNISYDAMNAKYYPRVLARVSGGPIPDDILNSPNYTSMRVFIENATAAGLDVVRSEVGFNWDIIREEIQGKRTPFASIGEWVFGCNSGAKNTLDRNYLADAMATGNVEVHTLHNATQIRKTSAGYEVHCDVLDQAGWVVEHHIIECKYLFMAAGSVHTTRLLLKAKALGDIPNVNPGVGQQWGTNGDELKSRNNISRSTGPLQGGPPSIAAFDVNNPIKPTGFMHAPTALSDEFSQLQMGMCIPDQNSTATYNPATDRLELNWSREANAPSTQALNHTMEKMLAVGGGTLDATLAQMGTWHPVGGAVMGVACSELGELLGVPNLFVVDGALLPGATGAANPSLTIGANAERIMEGLIPKLS